jgi:hypothetical protein
VFIFELFDDTHAGINENRVRLGGTATIRDHCADGERSRPAVKRILSGARRIKPTPQHCEAPKLAICNAICRFPTRLTTQLRVPNGEHIATSGCIARRTGLKANVWGAGLAVAVGHLRALSDLKGDLACLDAKKRAGRFFGGRPDETDRLSSSFDVNVPTTLFQSAQQRDKYVDFE